MQREEELRLREPALQSKHQINAHMQIVMQMNDLKVPADQGLMQL